MKNRIIPKMLILVAGALCSTAGDVDAAEFQIKCPAGRVRTEIVTDLPAPWWQTPQVGNVVGTDIRTIGGDRTLVCSYRAYGTRVSVMRKFPRRAKSCRAIRGGFVCQTAANPERVCHEQVQNRIAWDYTGKRTWDLANIRRLCRGTSSPRQPPRCFQKVMHGGVNWGGGTRWKWQNALDLCEGTNNADMTLRCFERHINRGTAWREAIRVCGN